MIYHVYKSILECWENTEQLRKAAWSQVIWFSFRVLIPPRAHPIICTDLQIRTTFGCVMTHPPTPKSKHSRQKKYVHFGTSIVKIYFLSNFVSTDNTVTLNLTAIHEKIVDLKKSWIKTVFLGVHIFFFTGNLITWIPHKHPPTQIRILYGFVNPYELLVAPLAYY